MQKVPFSASYTAAPAPPPPVELGETGRQLWLTVTDAFVVGPAEQHVLFLACTAADSAQSMRAQIESDGLVVTGSTGQLVQHPLLICEASAQKRVVQFLRTLGVFDDDEAKRGPGRPPARTISPVALLREQRERNR